MSKIILKNVRCSYVFVEKPRNDKLKKDGTVEKGKYGIQVMLKKDDPQVKEIRQLQATVAKEKFGNTVKAAMLKLPLRDGDAEREEEHYANMYFFNSSNSKKPGIVNKYNVKPTEEDLEEYCFSGAIFHVSLSFYGFDNEGKKGVAVSLKNVMLREKAERLDNYTAAETDFAEYAEDGADEFSDFSEEDENW